MKEIAYLTPIYGGINYSRLGQGGLQWPCTGLIEEGTKILFQDGFPRGKGKFHGVDWETSGEEPDQDFPLVLITGRHLYHYHTGTMTRRVEGLNALLSWDGLQINPADARQLELADGEAVWLVSPGGRVEMVLHLDSSVPPGAVFTSFHFSEAINRLTSGQRDHFSPVWGLKNTKVRLEKKQQCSKVSRRRIGL
jgi:formate dehydrogenase major subunit/formate dehydrogenase alpha subunit